MPEYRLSRLARQDLITIGRYTQRTWGVEQRRRYLDQLDRRMRFLAQNPNAGRRRDELASGYRSAGQGRHVIFYRGAHGAIEIVRILRASMDARHHLSAS